MYFFYFIKYLELIRLMITIGESNINDFYFDITSNLNVDIISLLGGSNLNIKDVKTTTDSTLILTNDCNVYGCGVNQYGELGLGHNTNTTELIHIASNISKIDCGQNHSLFLDLDGIVHSCGKNDLGQLGLSNYLNINELTNINLDNIEDISAGDNLSLFKKTNGDLYWCGKYNSVSNNIPQYFTSNVSKILADNNDIYYVNYINNINKNMEVIIASYYSNIINLNINNSNIYILDDINRLKKINTTTITNYPQLSSDNTNLIAWYKFDDETNKGLNSSMSPNSIGPAHTVTDIEFTTNELVFGTSNYLLTGDVDGKLYIDKDTGNLNNYLNDLNISIAFWFKYDFPIIKQIACGLGYTIFLTKSGEVWGIGYNRQKNIKNSDAVSDEEIGAPHHITADLEIDGQIKQIACGANHTIFITESGEVWGQGRNYNKQIKNSTETKIGVPHHITANLEIDGQIKQIAGGSGHTIFLTESGQVWGRGYNFYKQIKISGDGAPHHITADLEIDGQIKQIACGTYHTIFLTESGEVWGIGRNNYKQIRNSGDEKIGDPHHITYDLEIDGQIKQIACGEDFTIFLTESGEVWGQGRNVYKQIKNSDAASHEKIGDPHHITDDLEIDGQIKQIACGQDCTIFLTESGEVWGQGRNYKKQIKNSTETKIGVPHHITANLEIEGRIKQIAGGAGHTIFLTELGVVWGRGYNSVKQIKNSGDDIINTPYKIPPLTYNDNESIIFSGKQTIKTYEDFKLYYYDNKLNFGIGNGDTDISLYNITTEIHRFMNWTHVAIVIMKVTGQTNKAEIKIYIDGILDIHNNDYNYPVFNLNYEFYIGRWIVSNTIEGYLNDFRIYNKALTETEIDNLANVTNYTGTYNKIDKGLNNLIFTSTDNNIYTLNQTTNTNYGTTKSELSFNKLEFFTDKIVDNIFSSKHKDTTLFITSNNLIYNSGDLIYNNLVSKNTVNTPKLIHDIFDTDLVNIIRYKNDDGYYLRYSDKVLDNDKKETTFSSIDSNNIKKIDRTINSTVILTKEGTVYIYGNINSIPYQGIIVIQESPDLPESPEEIIIDISCGHEHVLFRTVNKKLYVLGSNSNAQLGTGDLSTDERIPKYVTINNEDIEDIICGYYNSIVKTNSNYYITVYDSIITFTAIFTEYLTQYTDIKKIIARNYVSILDGTTFYGIKEDGTSFTKSNIEDVYVNNSNIFFKKTDENIINENGDTIYSHNDSLTINKGIIDNNDNLLLSYKNNDFKIDPDIEYPKEWIYTSNSTYYMGNVAIGKTTATDKLDIAGELSTNYGKQFKITHPLDSNLWLYHSSIECPRNDNIYRGETIIKNGYVEVNIDKECNTTGGMIEGTFKKLNKNSQLFLQNNDTFDNVKGNIDNNIIKIYCENKNKDIKVNWIVIGERDDEEIKKLEITDISGCLICEHLISR